MARAFAAGIRRGSRRGARSRRSAAASAAETGGPLQIWFIRHAESEINVPGAPRPVPDGGLTYPLTRKGVAQAKTLADSAGRRADHGDLHEHAAARGPDRRCARLPHDLTLSLAPEAVEINLGIKPESHEDSRAVYLELARKWTVEKD